MHAHATIRKLEVLFTAFLLQSLRLDRSIQRMLGVDLTTKDQPAADLHPASLLYAVAIESRNQNMTDIDLLSPINALRGIPPLRFASVAMTFFNCLYSLFFVGIVSFSEPRTAW